jgi:hypothetical protein
VRGFDDHSLSFLGGVMEEQKPVAYINVQTRKLEWAKPMRWETPTIATLEPVPLYLKPTKPLTDDQITLIIGECAARHEHTDHGFARAIEAAHGIGGGDD